MTSPMLHAVRLAEQARGRTAPNPCVGAVLTRGDEVVAAGWHKGPGQPHAEVEALARARELGLDLTALTLWVTLEPCNHFGRTPPCTHAILEAGVPKVIIGTLDPNPAVAGGGAELLRTRGVDVVVGEEEQACLELIRDFRVWAMEQRPFVRLKLASTLDGRIATRSGHSAWVTGEPARERVQAMRAEAQAVLVGGGTLFADDPRLTNRSGRGGGQPLAVIVTSRLPGPESELFVLRKRPQELVFLTSREQARSETAAGLRDLGIRVQGVASLGPGGLDLLDGLRYLYQDLGCTGVLCEGGGHLGMSLMQAGAVDEFHLVLAPKVVGDEEAVSVLAGRKVQRMDEALRWRLISHDQVGDDMWLIYRPQAG